MAHAITELKSIGSGFKEALKYNSGTPAPDTIFPKSYLELVCALFQFSLHFSRALMALRTHVCPSQSPSRPGADGVGRGREDRRILCALSSSPCWRIRAQFSY